MKFITQRRYRRFIAKYFFLFPFLHKKTHIEIELSGGLCNKLHCLFSACDIAIKRKSVLIEPYFGWKQKILFSDIYDLDYFNNYMSKFNSSGKPLIVRRNSIDKEEIKIEKSKVHLWKYSKIINKSEQLQGIIKKDSTRLNVLRALKLKPEFYQIVNEHTKKTKFTALQVRTESDWVKYSEKKKINRNGESILVKHNEILEMVSKFDLVGTLFFTSGENHNKISTDLKELGIESLYYFNPSYEYEINAAINFEICCRAHLFIGSSRSSYSNLISFKRATLLNNDNSFIYNLNNKILKRIDKGLFTDAINCVERKIEVEF